MIFPTFGNIMITLKRSKISVSSLSSSTLCDLFNNHLAFNLINDIDVSQTEARIAAYRAENLALIELNNQREEQYAQALREQEEAERRDREQRALEARREEEEEREELERGHRDIINRLETSDKDAKKVIAKSRADALKRTSARSASNATATQSTSYAQLLRSRAAQSTTVPDVPHVPLQDNWYAYDDMFEMRGIYEDRVSEVVRKDREGIMRAGGYRVEDAWERALRLAVAGLDVRPLEGMDAAEITSGDVVMALV
jgi:CDK-activating kinase assembly factor MAT1